MKALAPIPSIGRTPEENIVQRYISVRAATERLAAPLTPEDQMVQSMPDASPTKWHLAHTTWFFETFLLKPHLPRYRDFHPHFTFAFNSYYHAVGERPLRPNRGLMSRPALEEVHRYREHVDSAMLELIPAAPDRLLPIIELGLNHEQQHQELILTDIKHAFWTQPLRPTYLEQPSQSSGSPEKMHWIELDGGIYSVGHDGRGFSFDNEAPRHEVLLQPFQIASRLVTNAEYLAFIEDGGYRRPELWLSDGWDTVRNHQWSAPLYWIAPGDQPSSASAARLSNEAGWNEFTLGGIRELHPDEPVCHLSYYEADAFARWAGARLATEFEWEAATHTLDTTGPPANGTFLEDQVFHPAPARSVGGLQQIFGDCWEWTSSPYVAYPGYRPVAGALGEYNAKFMCNQMVLRGGSCATPRSHIRASYRNFFPPHARWQFSGIRLAR